MISPWVRIGYFVYVILVFLSTYRSIHPVTQPDIIPSINQNISSPPLNLMFYINALRVILNFTRSAIVTVKTIINSQNILSPPYYLYQFYTKKIGPNGPK